MIGSSENQNGDAGGEGKRDGAASEARSESDPGADLPLIAIGASAGGLEPLEDLFEAAPADAGWCFVVIQHLSPDYRSVMDEILARRSSIKIRHIEDEMELAPDTLFLNPPNTLVELSGDCFHLTPYEQGEARPHMPIDAFFRSMTRRNTFQSVAVILSGSGADGAKGAADLHRAGGSVIVQTPREAKFDSMPLAVLASGSVDRVAEAARIPAAIRELLNRDSADVSAAELSTAPTEAIVQLLERAHHIDFSAYKSPTVRRRIERRQQLRGIESMGEYRDLVARDAEALEELFHDLLIGVTEFYRDPDAFSVLSQQALTKLATSTDPSQEIRVWVPGCASGEEAYSIAMELSEVLRQENVADRGFRILATDVHRQSVRQAGNGVYPWELVEKLPQEFRDRYFVETRDGWVVESGLRRRVIFSAHNALSDPPFMKLDLISCRNLLIYLDDEAQQRLLSMFLFGLKKDGFLFLGASESLGRYDSEFTTISSKWRLFRKASDRRVIDQHTLSKSIGRPLADSYLRKAANRDVRPSDVVLEGGHGVPHDREALLRAYDAFLKRFAPSSILITSSGTVLTWFGAAGRFIDTMSDLAEWTVEGLIDDELQHPINVGMERIRRNPTESYTRTVEATGDDGTTQNVRLDIEALGAGKQAGHFLLVRLESAAADGSGDSAETHETVDGPSRESGGNDDHSLLTSRIRELEKDLRLTEESLQYVTERLEASGEELQASNEELQASNEELQASNEEMQSSNEELQAVNEELVTVSAEHERKIDLLSSLNHDMELILGMLELGVILLDEDMKVLRFTEECGATFSLEEHDIGRLISNVGARPDFIDFGDFARDALERHEKLETSGEFNGETLEVRAIPFSEESGTLGRGVLLLVSGNALQPAAKE